MIQTTKRGENNVQFHFVITEVDNTYETHNELNHQQMLLCDVSMQRKTYSKK